MPPAASAVGFVKNIKPKHLEFSMNPRRRYSRARSWYLGQPCGLLAPLIACRSANSESVSRVALIFSAAP